MKRFEYKFFNHVYKMEEDRASWLNILGSEGWEAVSVSLTNNTDYTEVHCYVIAKREIIP